MNAFTQSHTHASKLMVLLFREGLGSTSYLTQHSTTTTREVRDDESVTINVSR